MSLQEYWQKIKSRARFKDSDENIHFDEEGLPVRFPLIRKVFLALLIILIGVLSFGLGKLSNLNQSGEIKIDYVDIDNNQDTSNKIQTNLNSTNSQLQTTNSSVTASSKGTRYYYSWCKSTVSDKNKVSFASAILAEKAGYTLAANCQPK